MTVCGYARVTTGGQSVDERVQDFHTGGIQKIWREKARGTTAPFRFVPPAMRKAGRPIDSVRSSLSPINAAPARIAAAIARRATPRRSGSGSPGHG